MGLFLVGCDGGGALQDSTTTDETTVVSGTVTDGGTAKSHRTAARSKATVGGATVSAVLLKNDGSTEALDATTTTESDGTFELEIARQTAGATVIVTAEKSGTGFSSSVGVQIADPAATEAQPMTPETAAEAQVATEINAQAEGSERADEALADAAALVDNDVASAILSGETAPENIAGLARSMDQAAEGYASDAGPEIPESDVAAAEADAYEKLQAALATASDSADRAQALSAFEQAMASSYEAAGASKQLQAEISQTGTQVALSAVGASALPDAAQRGLERRATVLRAIATGGAIEGTIANKGTGSDVSGPLASARETLVEAVRSADTASEIRAATEDYRSSVKGQLATGFNMSEADVQDGFDNLQSALDALDGALDTAIAANSDLEADAGAVSNAFQNYYENGVQTVTGVYSDRGMKAGPADAAAKVTAKVGVF
ncbi:MAG: hypothetical protein V5A22_00220 [Salinivenus sp.]